MFKVRKKVSTKIKPNIINMVFLFSSQYNSKEEAIEDHIKNQEAIINTTNKISSYESIASIFFVNKKFSIVNKKIKVEQEIVVTAQDINVVKDLIKDFHDSKSVTVNITNFDFPHKKYIEKRLLEQAFDAANNAADMQRDIVLYRVAFNRDDIPKETHNDILNICPEHRHLPKGSLVAEIVDWDSTFDEDQINFDFFNLDSFNKITSLQDKLNMLDGVEKEIFLKLEATYNVNYVKNTFPLNRNRY